MSVLCTPPRGFDPPSLSRTFSENFCPSKGGLSVLVGRGAYKFLEILIDHHRKRVSSQVASDNRVSPMLYSGETVRYLRDQLAQVNSTKPMFECLFFTNTIKYNLLVIWYMVKVPPSTKKGCCKEMQVLLVLGCTHFPRSLRLQVTTP